MSTPQHGAGSQPFAPQPQQWPTPGYPTPPPTGGWPLAGAGRAPRPVKTRRWPHFVGYPLVLFVGLIAGVGAGAASAGGTDTAGGATPARTVTRTVERTVAAQPATGAKPATGPAGGGPSAPKGVHVTGGHAGDVQVTSFKAVADVLGQFSVTIRLKNTSGDDLSFLDVKVTALRGSTIVATADDLVEKLPAEQTITTSPISSDDFPSSASKRAGITYEIQVD